MAVAYPFLALSAAFPEKHRLAFSHTPFPDAESGRMDVDKNLTGQDPEQVESLGLPVQPSYNVGLMISF